MFRTLDNKQIYINMTQSTTKFMDVFYMYHGVGNPVMK
jgi:hypothetical protein